jgi:hypothetical protein
VPAVDTPQQKADAYKVINLLLSDEVQLHVLETMYQYPGTNAWQKAPAITTCRATNHRCQTSVGNMLRRRAGGAREHPYPQFPTDSPGTDWNDHAALHGREATHAALAMQLGQVGIRPELTARVRLGGETDRRGGSPP